MENYILSYYQGIKDGSIIVGKWIRLVYEYIVHAIEDRELIYDPKKANAAIKWIEKHNFHTEGVLAPGAFRLELWEKAFISSIFGLIDPETKRRRFREFLLVVGRKNGKSLLASAIANYVFQAEGGYGCRVFTIAPKLEQADIIYSNILAIISLDKELEAKRQAVASARSETHNKVNDDPTVPKRRQSDIYLAATNSTIKKIAFSAKKSDGFNPSLCICDEIASWEGDKGLKQYEVMKSGTHSRPESILLSCTTSGYINDSIYDELVKRSTRFLLGESKEKRLLPFIYMIDDPERWADLNELKKANPNLGISIYTDNMLEEISIAEGSLSRKAEFLTKFCCVKQNSSLAWLPAKIVDNACGFPLALEDFRNSYCVGGIDLSQTRDLTACCVVIEKNGELYVFTRFFLPAERIDEAKERDGVPYDIYIKRGFLQLSGENFVDYHDCFEWFRGLVEEYQIFPLITGYDRYSAQYLCGKNGEMETYGFHMDDVYQGDNLHPVIQEVQGLLEDGKIHIGDNDLLKIHLLDSAIKLSVERGRGKLVKLSPSSHIDGTAALLDAMTVRQKYYAEYGERLKNEG